MGSKLNWGPVIQDMMTDDDGEILVGMENLITPERLLKKMGFTEKTTDPLTWFKLYNEARVVLNVWCRNLTKRGCNGKQYIAGGMNRNPTCYFVAKHKTEERYILQKKIPTTRGRLRAISDVGKHVIDVRKIDGVERKLGVIQDELDRKLPELEAR